MIEPVQSKFLPKEKQVQQIETLADGSTRRVGFPVRPRQDFVFIVDYGQPDRSPGGIHIPDNSEEFWRYRQSHWRWGEVIALGPGKFEKGGVRRLPMPPGLKVGDKVVFSRKFGTRLPKLVYDIRSMHYPEAGLLNVRVLDTSKIAGIENDFEPWWDLGKSQLNPDGTMTG